MPVLGLTFSGPSERRRIVTLDSSGTATTLLDLEQTGVMNARQGTFKVIPPARNQVVAKRPRRYAGARVVFETHDNAAITETLLVRGSNTDDCLTNVSSVYSLLESARTDLFFEWRPEGATYSVFFEIRGPAEIASDYEWLALAGANVLQVGVKIPVDPLARVSPQTFTISSTDLPAVVDLAGIGGDAPALADVTLRTSGGSAAPIWALLGWWPTPTATPLTGSVSPLGIIEAETAATLTTWALTGPNAAYHGADQKIVYTTTAGAGAASAEWVIDPSVLAADDFAAGEVDVEVWARVAIDGGVVSPRLTLSLVPDAGASFGNPVYTAEHGSAGRLLTVPSSGSCWRFVRLGVLTLPVDPAAPVKWRYKIAGSWAAGSTGGFGIDYLIGVPARARACSKSGVANDAYYPDFIASTSDTSKTIRHDLSGLVGSAAANKGRDSGLGGSPLELPPGDVSLLLKLSSLVPDDPTSDTTTEQLAHTATTGSVVVWPRYFLAKGA